MAYQYKYDDDIFDIESKPDVFTDAQFYPAQNKLIISIIQDNPLLRVESDDTFNQADQQHIIDRIKDVNPDLKDTTIVIENLKRIPSYDEWQTYLSYKHKQQKAYLAGQDYQNIPKPNNADESLIGWAHRLGIGNEDANGQPMKRPARGEAEHNEHGNFMNKDHHLYMPNGLRNPETGVTSPCFTNGIDYIDDINEYNEKSIKYIKDTDTGEIHTNKVMAQYYPIKDTDPIYDPDNPALHCGLTLGYNSTNYDLTMLAKMISMIDPTVFNSVYDANLADVTEKLKTIPGEVLTKNTQTPTGGVPLANHIRTDLNDILFSKYLDKMWQFIDYGGKDYDIKNSWLKTNRFLDVSKFNEHQRKVSLKRISGMVGLQIKESDKLGDDHDEVGTLENLAELIAYNVSDVYNTMLLFENPVYQDGFKLKQSLIKTYPAVVYQQDQDEDNIQSKNSNGTINYGREPIIDPLRIRRDRLCADDSSAKFIANVISPYEKLQDNPMIDLHYPAEEVLADIKAKKAKGIDFTDREVRDKPYDVLEDTADWVYGRGYYKDEGPHMGPNGQAEFEKIYKFYDQFRGHNVNDSLSINNFGYQQQLAKENFWNWLIEHNETANYMDLDHVSEAAKTKLSKIWRNQSPFEALDYLDRIDENAIKYPQDVDIKHIMQTNDTNVFYMNGNDEKTSSIANLSIGGIHGAEIKLSDYRKELEKQAEWNRNCDFIKEHYDSIEDAYKSKDEIEFPDKQTHKVRDFMMSKSTGKKAYLKSYKLKELFHLDSASKIEKLRKEYTYVSVGKASHEDFSSYYPTLLTMLAVFRDPDDGSDVYADVYHERLALKAKLKTLKFGSPEYKAVNLEQNLRKLLLNSASGAGDATFESNIKMNNATISMRIIGQLFAWRIGQAEANHGARVPSTNTDGLYVMDIEPEINDKVLFHTVDPMLINIDPEVVDRFVSKDANNRVEVDDGVIQEAKGGTLTSWQGPSPQNNLSHPAICDAVLAHYLAEKPSDQNPDSPCDQEFDRQYAANIFERLMKDGGSFDANHIEKLKLLQWVLASGLSKHRHNFYHQYQAVHSDVFNDRSHDKSIMQKINSGLDASKYGEQEIDCTGIQIPRTNRIFMTRKPADGEIYNTVELVTKRKIPAATMTKRRNKWKKEHPDDNASGYDPIQDSEYQKPADVELMKKYVDDKTLESFKDNNEGIVTAKVTDMPDKQPVLTYNQALSQMTTDEYNKLFSQLDISAYLDIIENKFNNSWKN